MQEVVGALQVKLQSSVVASADTYAPLSSAAAAAADKWQKRVAQVPSVCSKTKIRRTFHFPDFVSISPLTASTASRSTLCFQSANQFCVIVALSSDSWTTISLDSKITIESKVFEEVSDRPCFRGR
jgi:hypothetical protein